MTLRVKTNLFAWFVFLVLLQHMASVPVKKKNDVKMAGPVKQREFKGHNKG